MDYCGQIKVDIVELTDDWQTMLELEEPDPFYKLYSKVGIENSNAGVKLRRYLKNLDSEKNVLEINRKNEIFEEKMIAHQLKQNVKMMRRNNTADVYSSFSKRDSGLGTASVLPEKTRPPNDLSPRQNEDSIFVSGYRLSSGNVKPRMFFWSQDSSTKLPTPTAFYGYEHPPRPLTEVKLLGQDVYYGNTFRATQSADPRPTREKLPTRSAYTSGDPKFDDVEKIPVLERAKTDIPNHNDNKHVVNLAKTNNFAKIYDLRYEPPKACDPVELKLNLKKETGSQENLSGLLTKSAPKPSNLWVGDPKAIDSVRRPRRRIAEMLLNFRTREEARRCYREMLLRTPCSKNCQVPKIVTELEKTYNEIPMLASEVNRLKSDVERDPTIDGKQYTKSKFGVNMQTSISKKVLNKKGLPVAFRKTNNTFLKHYGGSIMEERTPRHYNTPDIFIETI